MNMSPPELFGVGWIRLPQNKNQRWALEDRNEPSGSVKWREFLNLLQNY
jgi:hypothetical protein